MNDVLVAVEKDNDFPDDLRRGRYMVTIRQAVNGEIVSVPLRGVARLLAESAADAIRYAFEAGANYTLRVVARIHISVKAGKAP